jgi:putative tryptophan/tyrosine transport system substrate-binding protein
MSRVAYLAYVDNPAAPLHMQQLQVAARKFDLTVTTYQADRHAGPETFEAAFASMAEAGVNAVIVDALLTPLLDPLVELGNRYRLPLASSLPVFAEDGGLLSVGADMTESYGRLAGYVDRILKGAKPSELPLQQPNRYVVIVNLKTAKTLGLTIPPSLLARADEVIE